MMDGVLSIRFSILADGIVIIAPTVGRPAAYDLWRMFDEVASVRGKRVRIARLKRDEIFRRRLLNAGAEAPEIEIAEQFLHAWLDAASYEIGVIRAAEKEAAWAANRWRRADHPTGRRAA